MDHEHLFARGIKSQTHVRIDRIKTSHRQFPKFEKRGSREALCRRKPKIRKPYTDIYGTYKENGDNDTRNGGI